ncbi:Secreted protein [Pseudonocardia sp. Ae707_Ps1]|nr:Secreted protein [Pseudonocardia sp. Ae707_Ps1]
MPTDLGPAPAWRVAPPSGADGGTWALCVHGRGGTGGRPCGAARLHAAGLTSLVVSYRGDGTAPAAPDGRSHLGDTEWEDVAAAAAYAVVHGARRLVLVGWSMGAAVGGAFLDRSSHAGRVAAVVWDAPLLDWRRTLRRQARNRALPPSLAGVAALLTERRIGIDLDRFDLVRNPPRGPPADAPAAQRRRHGGPRRAQPRPRDHRAGQGLAGHLPGVRRYRAHRQLERRPGRLRGGRHRVPRDGPPGLTRQLVEF